MTEKNEMLALAERISKCLQTPHEPDELFAPLFDREEWAAIVSALRAAAASAEPVAWRALCENTGGQLVVVDGLKDMLVEQAYSIYNNSGGYIVQPLSTHPAPVPASVREAPTIDDVPSCGQENDFRRAR